MLHCRSLCLYQDHNSAVAMYGSIVDIHVVDVEKLTATVQYLMIGICIVCSMFCTLQLKTSLQRSTRNWHWQLPVRKQVAILSETLNGKTTTSPVTKKQILEISASVSTTFFSTLYLMLMFLAQVNRVLDCYICRYCEVLFYFSSVRTDCCLIYILVTKFFLNNFLVTHSSAVSSVRCHVQIHENICHWNRSCNVWTVLLSSFGFYLTSDFSRDYSNLSQFSRGLPKRKTSLDCWVSW